MADVTIKDVPEGAEADVKRMAMTAIERFLRLRDLKVDEAKVTKCNQDIRAIKVANQMEAVNGLEQTER
jgi:hypothetical protein